MKDKLVRDPVARNVKIDFIKHSEETYHANTISDKISQQVSNDQLNNMHLLPTFCWQEVVAVIQVNPPDDSE